MSRISKWKFEKTKVKVVFRLQFHATHIPQTGWDKLFISFIPGDSGKATAKTTKANVRNGTCKWGDPIYESTQLLQDTKSKKLDEKLYKFVVTMGSSRSSVLGEAIINLADYADASKPSAVALPLHGCDFGTILHVTVQLLTSKTGFREFEQQRELRESGFSTTSDQSRNDVSTAKRISLSDDTINVKSRSKEELSPLEQEAGLNKEYPDSTVGFDVSSSTSESLYADKHDTSTTHEIDSVKSTTSGDLGGLSLGQSPRKEKRDPSDQQFLVQGTNEWAHSWASDYSGDVDLSNAYEENARLRGSLEAAEASIIELKQQVSSLQSHADEIGMEAQKFSLQLDAEISSGERLAKEVSMLRSECSKLKEDLEERKDSNATVPFTSRETFETGQDHFLHEVQLRWFKGFADMEDKIRELQRKTTVEVHERDLHSDLDALLGALQVLKPVTGRAILGMNMQSVKDTNEMSVHKDEQLGLGTRFDAEFYQPEGMLHSLSMPGLVSQEFDSLDATNAMKSKLFELLREVDELKAERESLAKKADQMECYYEALINELEENQRQIMGELQSLRNEHSTCLYTISSAKAEMERIQLDMNNEITRLSKEKHDSDSLNKELERRAVTAEAALKRARLNYSIAVDHLQKDLEVLSSQVLSMHETNENLIKQAFEDSVLPSFKNREVSMQNQNFDSEILQAGKRLQRPNQYWDGPKKQHLDGDMLLDDLRTSLLSQKETCQKAKEEIYEVHLVNVYLDIFSKTLEVTLIEASADLGLVKENVHELTQQLELSTKSKQLLMLRLQAALDEIQCLNADKDIWNSKCNDLTLKNQNLEEDLQSSMRERDLFAQKIVEWEGLVKEYEIYESKYKACSTEKLELENLLRKETIENENLQNRVSSLEEELKAVRTDFDGLTYVKESLQNTVTSSHSKLWNLLASYDKKFSGLSLCIEYDCRDLESKDLTHAVVQIEELQHRAFEKIVQLIEEKNSIEQERDISQVSLRAAESDNLIMKEKFEQDLQGMVNKVADSNALVQKLQLQVGAIANKLEISSEIEEKYAQQHRELLSDLDHSESELQKISSKYQDLVEEMMALETARDELEKCKLQLAALSEEKEALVVSIQEKTEECLNLSMEVNSLQSRLWSSHDELHIEKNERDKFVNTITDLTSQLNEKHSQLLDFDQHKNEMDHLKQLLSESELEKSRVSDLLLNCEECLKDAHEDCSAMAVLESQLFEMHEFSIATDVRLTYTNNQYETRIEELDQKPLLSDSSLSELHNNNLQVETLLNRCLARERHLVEENSKLLTSLKDAGEECSYVSALEAQLSELLEYSVAADVGFTFAKAQYDTGIEELAQKLFLSDSQLSELCNKHLHVESRLNECLANERHYIEENTKLLTSLSSLNSDLEASVAQNKILLESNNSMRIELEEHTKQAENIEAIVHVDKSDSALAVERLERSLVTSEEEIDNLIFCKEELETKFIVLKAKLDEHCIQVASLEAYKDELTGMHIKECNELKQRLAEQVLKAEEFKNLSIHFKELKDKSCVECSHTRDKGESEAPPAAMQDSLRIAFIKEQYETKLQELKQQLAMSQKHCEEMLWKLQDAINEVESRKKSEATHLKRNEELGMRILELESELHALLSEKREITKAYDLMKAEKECSLISLDCCKEEKQELQVSLRKCNEEKAQITLELTSAKALLESASSFKQTEGSERIHKEDSIDERDFTFGEAAGLECLNSIDEGDQSKLLSTVQPEKDLIVSRGINGTSSVIPLKQKDECTSDMKHLALANEHFRTRSLRSSMESLDKELERLKHENFLLPEDDHNFESNFPGLQNDLMQLNKVNEELGSIFPSFNEYSYSGNALERVLALEIELAEALQAKKKSTFQFQSSFLKQHDDEEAVFHSFRDINELIKDMLEIKGRYATVETELKEMHDRYSQLSLQFAEVEGERQKLMMTLKNVRASKKASFLNRSLTTTLMDP